MSEEIEKKTVVLPEPGSLVLSTSPHVQDGDSISKIMLKVLICLIPAVIAAIWFFRFNAVRILARNDYRQPRRLFRILAGDADRKRLFEPLGVAVIYAEDLYRLVHRI